MKGILSFEYDGGVLDVSDDALIVGIDETGCEDYKDKENPVFGLGGCAVLAKDFFRLLDTPWSQMKELYFGGASTQLHASDLRRPTSEQLEALGNFFTKFPFYRFATMSANSFNNDTRETNIHLLAVSVMNQLAKFGRLVQPTEVIFVCDSSNRIEKDLVKHFSTYRFNNGKNEIFTKVLLATKDKLASCVEVADFVVHPAGAQVRNRVLGKYRVGQGYRKDFELVFNKVDGRLSDYQEMLSATVKDA